MSPTLILCRGCESLEEEKHKVLLDNEAVLMEFSRLKVQIILEVCALGKTQSRSPWL